MDDDILSRVAGVGDTEQEALEMFLDEFNGYIESNGNNTFNGSVLLGLTKLSVSDLMYVDFPGNIVVEDKNKSYYFYYKIKDNKIIVLTENQKFVTDYIFDFKKLLTKICNNLKENKSEKISKEYLEDKEFYPNFESLSK